MPQILFFRENDLQPREMAGIIIDDSCSYGGIFKNPSILHHFKKWKHSTFVKLKKHLKLIIYRGFPGGAVVENLPANAGDMGSSPGLGRSHMLRSN